MLQANSYHRNNYCDSIYKEEARQRIVPFVKGCKIGATLSGTTFKTEQKLLDMYEILSFELDRREYGLGKQTLKQLQGEGKCNNVTFLNDSIYAINPTEFDFINFDLTSVVSPMTINQLISKLQRFKGVAFITLSEKIRNCGILNELDLYLDQYGDKATDCQQLARVAFPKIIEAHTDLKMVDMFTYKNRDISAHATPMIQFGFKNI